MWMEREDRAMTVLEAAEYLGVGRSLMYRLVRTRQVEAFRVGRAVRILQSTLDRIRGAA